MLASDYTRPTEVLWCTSVSGSPGALGQDTVAERMGDLQFDGDVQDMRHSLQL